MSSKAVFFLIGIAFALVLGTASRSFAQLSIPGKVMTYRRQHRFGAGVASVDAVLADRGIDDWNTLMSVQPEELGRLVNADAIV